MAFFRMYHKGLVAGLIHSSWKVRKASRQSIRRLYSSPLAIKLSLKLLQEYRILLAAQKVGKIILFAALSVSSYNTASKMWVLEVCLFPLAIKLSLKLLQECRILLAAQQVGKIIVCVILLVQSCNKLM